MDIQTDGKMSLSDRLALCDMFQVELGMDIELLLNGHTVSGTFLGKRDNGDVLILRDKVTLIYSEEIQGWSISEEDMDKILTSSETKEKEEKEKLNAEIAKQRELNSDPLYKKIRDKYAITHDFNTYCIVKKGFLFNKTVMSVYSSAKYDKGMEKRLSDLILEEYKQEKAKLKGDIS